MNRKNLGTPGKQSLRTGVLSTWTVRTSGAATGYVMLTVLEGDVRRTCLSEIFQVFSVYVYL